MVINDVKGMGKISPKVFGLVLAASCGHAEGGWALAYPIWGCSCPGRRLLGCPSRSFLAREGDKGDT